MYRYSVDNTIVFSSDDLVLFRESPFAVWMERLTLEHPDHGIPPDRGSEPPRSPYGPQVAFAANLRGNRRDFEQIGWHQSEEERRYATLNAMRRGVHFIVDGHLSDGLLSGPVNLLVRASGRSALGDYLYMPGDTQGGETAHDPFRLCFIADLLHTVQGQLPPQLLLVDPEAGLHSLPTEDHVHYYRAVKERFLASQNDFDSNLTPDPSLSSHCGRWSGYANEILRQGQRPQRFGSAAALKIVQQPEVSAANAQDAAGPAPALTAYNFDAFSHRFDASEDSGGTLAEQAKEYTALSLPAGDDEAADEPSLKPLHFIAESNRPPDLLQNVTELVMAPHPLYSRGYIGAHIWCTPGPPRTPTGRRRPRHTPSSELQITVAGA